MKSPTAKNEVAYSKCSFYKPYLSFLERKPANNNTKSTSKDKTNNNNTNHHKKKNVVQFYVDDENENSTAADAESNNHSNASFRQTHEPPPTSSPSASSSAASSSNLYTKTQSTIEFRDLERTFHGEVVPRRPRVPHHLRKSSKLSNLANLDHILIIIGQFGFFQKMQFMLVGFLAIVPSMVAYSYVFVSATPKFTCAIAKEIVLINYDASSNKLFNRLDIDDESDNPFSNFELQKSEYFIETRRFIRLLSRDQLRNKTFQFDNKCEIDPSMLKKIALTSTSGNNQTTRPTMSKSTFKCAEWLYDDSMYGKTTVTDWNLVCLKSHLKAVTQNFFILGTGCSLFTGILSDRYGRKSVLMFLILVMVLVLNITQFFMHTPALTINQKFVAFTVSRFLQGVAQTMYSISFVLLLEITGPSHRVLAGQILAYSFSIGQMAIVGLAYYFKNWLKVQWALAIYLIPFLMYYWLVPESPRWLLSVNRVESARRVIEKIARINRAYENTVQSFLDRFYKGKKVLNKEAQVDVKNLESWTYIFSLLQEEAGKLSQQKANSSYKRTLTGITRSPILMRRCFILFYVWMVILAVYLGIGMGISGNLDRFINPHLVFLIAACCEFASVVTCRFVLDTYGRKYPLVIFITATGIAIYLIPVHFESYPWVSIVVYFAAKYSIAAAQTTCMIFTSELYPTPMRSTGVGLSVSIARLGGVLAPQINVLSSTLGSIYIPFVIFSVLSLLAAFVCLFLPETLNKKLPENIREAKALNRKY